MLIAFSGLDGAGKSTQIDILTAALRAQGRRPVRVWMRGGYTPLFNAIKKLARRGRALPPSGPSQARSQALARPGVRRLWLTLALVDLLLTCAVRLRAWLLTGRTVVCDRYIWDTLIDFRLNFPEEQVERGWLWRWLTAISPRPDAAFLMIISVDEALRRSAAKGEPFPDSAETLAARRHQYLALARQAGWVVIDGAQPLEAVTAQVMAHLPPAGRARQAA